MAFPWSTVVLFLVAGLFAVGTCTTEERYYENKEGKFVFEIEQGPKTVDVLDPGACEILHWSKLGNCVTRPCYKRLLKNLQCNKTHIVFTLKHMGKSDTGTFKVIGSNGTVLENRTIKVEAEPTGGPSTEQTPPADASQKPSTTAVADNDLWWRLLILASSIRVFQEVVLYAICRKNKKDSGCLKCTCLTELSWWKIISLIIVPLSCFMLQACFNKCPTKKDEIDNLESNCSTSGHEHEYEAMKRMNGNGAESSYGGSENVDRNMYSSVYTNKSTRYNKIQPQPFSGGEDSQRLPVSTTQRQSTIRTGADPFIRSMDGHRDASLASFPPPPRCGLLRSPFPASSNTTQTYLEVGIQPHYWNRTSSVASLQGSARNETTV